MNKPSTTKKSTESKKDIPEIKVTEFKVLKARVLDSGSVSFDLQLNGLTIYGCFVAESKENGDFISLPQRKGTNGKYYSIVWCKFSKKDSDDILKEVERIINE